MDLVTGSQLAEILGVTKQAVSKARKAGRVSHSPGTRMFERGPTVARWRETAGGAGAENGKASGHNGIASRESDSGGDYYRGRAVLTAIRAKRERLELEREEGSLVDAREVERLYFERAREARDALLALPARLGRMLAGISDPDECERRLRDEVRALCTKLAGEGR